MGRLKQMLLELEDEVRAIYHDAHGKPLDKDDYEYLKEIKEAIEYLIKGKR